MRETSIQLINLEVIDIPDAEECLYKRCKDGSYTKLVEDGEVIVVAVKNQIPFPASPVHGQAVSAKLLAKREAAWPRLELREEPNLKENEAYLVPSKKPYKAFTEHQNKIRELREKIETAERKVEENIKSCANVLSTCHHEFVNQGFTSITMACKHCGEME